MTTATCARPDIGVTRAGLLDAVDDLLLFLEALSAQEDPEEISGPTAAVLDLLGAEQAAEVRRIARGLLGSGEVTLAETAWCQLCHLAVTVHATLTGFAEGDSILDLHSLAEALRYARKEAQPVSPARTR